MHFGDFNFKLNANQTHSDPMPPTLIFSFTTEARGPYRVPVNLPGKGEGGQGEGGRERRGERLEDGLDLTEVTNL